MGEVLGGRAAAGKATLAFCSHPPFPFHPRDWQQSPDSIVCRFFSCIPPRPPVGRVSKCRQTAGSCKRWQHLTKPAWEMGLVKPPVWFFPPPPPGCSGHPPWRGAEPWGFAPKGFAGSDARMGTRRSFPTKKLEKKTEDATEGPQFLVPLRNQAETLRPPGA